MASPSLRTAVVEMSIQENALPMTAQSSQANRPKIHSQAVSVYYGEKRALNEVDLDIGSNQVTALIGPSGCGKSTYLRCLNRMNETIEGCRVTGTIELDGQDIHGSAVDVVQLRARVGMVFQKPNPFPKSIYDNVAYGPRIHGLARNKDELDEIVQSSLKRAGLIKEVHDRLDQPGTGLSGGQQQRLCIARAIAVSPEVILMDEPSMGLAPAVVAIVLGHARSIADAGIAVVMVEQNADAGLEVADSVVTVRRGEIAFSGSAAEARNDKALIRAFLGESALTN